MVAIYTHIKGASGHDSSDQKMLNQRKVHNVSPIGVIQ